MDEYAPWKYVSQKKSSRLVGDYHCCPIELVVVVSNMYADMLVNVGSHRIVC